MQPSGAITTTQGALCDLLENTPAGPVSDVLNNLIGTNGTLGGLTSALEDLIGPNGQLAPVNELLVMLVGANEDGALTPVIQGLNSILVLLNAGADPAAIADALAGLGGGAGGGSNGPTGTPLDALLTLGGDANPLTALLGALGGAGALPGTGGGTDGGTGNIGLITQVQGILGDVTNDTPLVAVSELVDTLLDPQSGALEPLTAVLEDLTNVSGGPLGPLSELVDGLIAADDAALAPVITALNGVLVGLLTNQDPAEIAAALQGLAGGLSAGGGSNPLAGLIPSAGGGTGGGTSDGVISGVQDTVDNLLGNTPLAPVQDLVNMLVDPNAGALAPLTGVLNEVTSSGEALGQLNDLVDALVAEDDAALAPVIDTLNGILSGGAGTGTGGGAVPGLDALNQIPVVGPVLGGLLGGLLGGITGGLPI